MFLPIQHDTKRSGKIEEKQKFMWEQLHSRMDQRHKEWKNEMEELRRNFFRGTSLSPTNTLQRSTSLNFQSLSPTDFATSPILTSPTPFYHEFDVKLFKPDEITVLTRGNKLMLQASHKELNLNKSVSREFKREIDIPTWLDPPSLRCSLTSDGRLIITTQQHSFTPQSTDTNNDLPFLRRQQQQHSPISSQEPSELSLSRDECDSLESNSDETCVKNEWTTPLPDVVDNHSIYSEADTTTPNKSPPKCDSSRRFNLDASIKSIHCEGRPFSVNINLGRSIEPTQLKIDAIDRILLVRVFMYDSFGHTGVWKVYLPRDLDPSDVAAQLTDEGHLILEEAFPLP